MKETRLFGTDGIRGVAGEYPLDPRSVFIIGRALGEFLRERQLPPRVLIGQDTRESSRWIAEALAAGLARENVTSVSAGVLPTPGLAYLSRTNGFSAGVMISASHNPYQDNGIKVFAHSGYKLPDEDELAVEKRIFHFNAETSPESRKLQHDAGLRARYEDFLCSVFGYGLRLDGLSVVLDCANGAAYQVAPEVFRRLGAKVTAIHTRPDGRNINLDCGSLHTESLQQRAPAERATLGVAFDGDADRALFVTARGELVNGDGVLFLTATRLHAKRALKNNVVVGTIMSNLGLEVALERRGIRLLRTPVGDKYVLEEMLRQGANLGGEQSGHVIFSDQHTTGDGLLTALKVVEIIATTGSPLEELVAELKVFPQIIRNVRVREKIPFEKLPEVSDAIRASQSHFGTRGRVVVRYSGTELLARVMVEARNEADVLRHADAIAAAVQRTIGKGSDEL